MHRFRRLPVPLLLALGAVLYGPGVLLHGAPGPALRLAAEGFWLLAAAMRPSLTGWTLLAMVCGVECGIDLPHFAVGLHFLVEIFLRLIRTVVAPLVLCTLAAGIAAHGELRATGRIAAKTLVYFEAVTTAALGLGLLAIHLSQAGVRLRGLGPAVAHTALPAPVLHGGWRQIVVGMVPDNLASAVAGNQILAVAVFALGLGAALAMLPEAKRAPLLGVLQSAGAAMFAFTRLVMLGAPVAAGAALAFTVGSIGVRALLPLGTVVVTFYAACLGLVLFVFLPVALVARLDLRRLAHAVAEPVALAFATSTSEAALPLAMERMEEFGVARPVVALVIPAGYSFNMDGASLYLGIAAIFAVQASGTALGWKGEAAMLGTLLLLSKGLAGVPRAVLVILLAAADTVHLPSAPLFLLLGVDAVLDMGRSAINVLGNCLAAAVVGASEARRELRQQAPDRPA